MSPFTSNDKSVRSVVDLLREGRAALATNFGSFKFLVMYGQSFSILKLMAFQMGVVMCKMSYVMIDLVGALFFTYVMTIGQPADKLPPTRPTSSLIGFTSLASVFGAQLIHVIFLIGALSFIISEPSYVEWPVESIEDFGSNWLFADNWETDVLYFGIFLPWISTAVSFSYGHHWRKPVWNNYFLMATWIAMFGFNSYLLMSPNNDLTNAWHVSSIEFNGDDNTVWQDAGESQPPMPGKTRAQLWCIVVCACICATLWEKIFVLGPGKSIFKTRKHDRPDYVHLRI